MARCKGHQQEDRTDKGMGSLGTGSQGGSVRSDHCAVEEARCLSAQDWIASSENGCKRNVEEPCDERSLSCSSGLCGLRSGGREKQVAQETTASGLLHLERGSEWEATSRKGSIESGGHIHGGGGVHIPSDEARDTTPQDVPLPGVDWDGEEPVEAPLPAEDNEDLVEEDQEEMR